MALGCSPDTLTQRYRAHSGNALWSDVVRLRLERAAQLLRDETLAVKEVASRVRHQTPQVIDLLEVTV